MWLASFQYYNASRFPRGVIWGWLWQFVRVKQYNTGYYYVVQMVWILQKTRRLFIKLITSNTEFNIQETVSYECLFAERSFVFGYKWRCLSQLKNIWTHLLSGPVISCKKSIWFGCQPSDGSARNWTKQLPGNCSKIHTGLLSMYNNHNWFVIGPVLHLVNILAP